MRIVSQADLTNKRVLIRAGLNVPMKDGTVTDVTRLKAAMGTIKHCLQHARQVIVCGHIGRPKEQEPTLSTQHLVSHFERGLNQKVHFHDALTDLPDDKLILLENTRFHAGEKKNDTALAKQFAQLADVFVLDAFADMHRAHATTYGIAQLLPTYAGILVQREVMMLERVLKPDHPFVAIVGFAKVGDKLPILERLFERVDRMLFCGAIIFSFYKAAGVQVGNSFVDEESIPLVKKLLNKYGPKIQLPTDIVVADAPESQDADIVPYNKIPEGKMGLDIGPVSTDSFKDALTKAETVFWNGPAGVFEYPPYDAATNALATHLATLHNTTVVGGGDTASAVRKAGVADVLSHVSTGGGASLEFLAGDELPGLQVVGYYDVPHTS